MALATIATSAYAAVRLYAVRANNWSSAGPAQVAVPLNAGGATTMTFNLPAAGRNVLTCSAECAVDAPAGNNSAWLDLDLVVNGVTVAPTAGNSDAFYTAAGSAGISGHTRSSITVVIAGNAGADTGSVLARGNAGAGVLWLGDSALVIHD